MPWKMSEGPNKNCEFFENYENYDNYENLQRSQKDLMRITKTVKIRKRTKKASNMSEGRNENCEFYENYENYKNCKYSQGSLRDPMRITKTVKIPKGTKKTLRKPSWCRSGPMRTAKIGNIMIIRKTGKLANFPQKNMKYQTYIKENCLRNKGYNLTEKHHQWWKTCISALSLCNSLFHLSIHLPCGTKFCGF